MEILINPTRARKSGLESLETSRGYSWKFQQGGLFHYWETSELDVISGLLETSAFFWGSMKSFAKFFGSFREFQPLLEVPSIFCLLRITANLGKTASVLLFLDCEHQADTNPWSICGGLDSQGFHYRWQNFWLWTSFIPCRDIYEYSPSGHTGFRILGYKT